MRAAKHFSFSENQMTAFRLFAQVLGAADFLLSNGVVFRDFKNANVLVEKEPLSGKSHARLTDFGLAEMRSKQAELRPPRTTIEGTEPFLAPELFHFDSEGHFPTPYSKLTEMYALGVMLYEVVTGSYPITFGKDDIVAVKVVRAPPDSPSKFRTGIPSELQEVCLKALSKVPKNRFQSPAEFLDALCETLPEARRNEVRSAAWISRFNF